MKRCRHSKIGLPLFFSLAVFFIFAVTALIIAFIGYLAYASGLIESLGGYGRLAALFATLVSCVIVGTIVSFIMGQVPLKPIRKVIAAINRLAAGDFSTRLDIRHPPEFRELSESFNRMAQELSGTELLRTDFVNHFSHEFKTPIVSIKGFAQLLKEDRLEPRERETYLDIIIQEANRLTALATNVLNLSKVENQIILTEKRPFNLSEQIRRCILLLQERWERKRIDLSLDMQDITLAGNADMLDQVWLNLLDNAIKFTPAGGAISLSLTQSGGMARFTLRDSGCGISPEVLSRIFDKFYQADPGQSCAGNGLGLAVARKIIELHGGNITCQSEPGRGAAFFVELPLG